MLSALVIAMLTGITVWWFLVQRLKTKPWMEQGILSGSQEGLTSSAPKVGLWVFLGMVSSLFLVFIGAYIMRKDHGHGGGMQEWVAVDDPSVLWLNTAVLVLASVAMQRARGAAGRANIPAARRSFLAGGALTLVFLVGQLWAWQILASTELYGPETPAYAFFILLTAVHGLHLLGGLAVLARAAHRMRLHVDPSDVVTAAKLRTSVELCTTYWHFLLVVWLALFWLLLST
ncbi:MAG TPA: cytochrome c oxidase subunit 3 [Gammaproteobacteria bacterium]